MRVEAQNYTLRLKNVTLVSFKHKKLLGHTLKIRAFLALLHSYALMLTLRGFYKAELTIPWEELKMCESILLIVCELQFCILVEKTRLQFLI